MATELACQVRRALLTGLVLSRAIGPVSGATNSAWLTPAWQSEEGLPNNTVRGLAQTPDGYLWLGTPSGLARFDGLNFEDFAPTNFVAPPNRGTHVMLLGRSGCLWIAMDRGAVVCLRGKGSQAFTAGLPSTIPYDLAEDAEGSIWVSYRSGGVYQLKAGKVTTCTPQAGLPAGPDMCALASDNQGRVWFAKAGQFGMMRDGAFRTAGRFAPQAARLAAARAGGVWLCAGFHLSKVSDTGQVQDFGEFPAERARTVPNVLLEDHEGAVWIGTSFSGLFRHDASGFEAIPTVHQAILSLAEDREGDLWAGTDGGGLNRIRRRAISLEGPESGLPFAAVQSLCEDQSGTLWAATQNGVLARRVEGQWHPIPAAADWPGAATCVESDQSGALWVGTSQHGLYCWRDGRFVTWGDRSQIRWQTLHTLLASSGGDLWIGEEGPGESPGCIQHLHDGRVRTFEVPANSRIIRAMAEDTAGNIWAGTSKGNLFRIRGDQLTDATPRASRELASIRCLHATPDGGLWLGYAGWGVGWLKEGRYGEVTAGQGLYDNYISMIVADGHGWLWFGADRGIFRVRQPDLEAAAQGRPVRVRSMHYGRGEGLPGLQGNFGDSPGVLRSRDGRLWIPMRTALAVVEPQKLAGKHPPPPTLLHRVSIDDRTAAWYGGVLPRPPGTLLDLSLPEATLPVPPRHRRLEFAYAAPSFAAPESVQFRYRLEGFDEDWIEAGTKRSASYSRLSAGGYLFRVVACNSEGAWAETGAALALSVTPFFYQTWWFRIAGFTVFTLSIAAIVRYVSFRRLHHQLRLLEQQAALDKERARIAKDIHDDLGASLTQISLLGELAQQDRGQPEKAAERSGTIAATARQAIKSLDEIVWAVNPRNDTLAHLVDYAGQFALDYLRLAGIRCRLDFPEQAPQRQLSTDVRHNLFLVIKEALHNIVKHAQASEVWFRVKPTDTALEVAIEDNGRGFGCPPDDALADGLRNMRQRLADLGGECRIESQPGQGTRVALCLPWPKS